MGLHSELNDVGHGKMRSGIEGRGEVLGSDNTETNVTKSTRESSSDGEISTAEDGNHFLHLHRLITKLQKIDETRLKETR